MEPAIHPILNFYYSRFISEHEKAAGILLRDNMDEFELKESLKLNGSYFICNSSIKFDLKESVLFTGAFRQDQPTYGSALLAGRAVSIKVPRMGCFGSVDDPVVILGLESVSIDITVCAKIMNLVIYLMKDAKFSFSAAGFSAFENIQVIRINQNGDDLEMAVQFDWRSHDDFLKSALVGSS
jgi:hypothetical protein